MQYDAFLERVGELAGVSREEAEEATRAVLLTLSERIGAKESSDTSSQLPMELKEAFFPGPEPEYFDAREFVRRVAQRAGIGEDAALARTRAVFATLHEAVSHGELEDWEGYLSTDYVNLAARHAETGSGPRGGEPGTPGHAEPVVTGQEFTRRVAQRAGLDEEGAQRAIDAVLETLGERIAGGEARDLALQLPEPAAEPLRRADGDPKPIPAEQFVELVADREHEPPIVAREHARAVLTTVRESVTADEWRDTLAELPREYEELLAPPPRA